MVERSTDYPVSQVTAISRSQGEGVGAPRSPDVRYAPNITRVPVDGITSLAGISPWTAMIVLMPVQCMGMT